jgi:hypothetical protein
VFSHATKLIVLNINTNSMSRSMKPFINQEIRDKLLEIPQVKGVSSQILTIYVKEVNPEVEAKIKEILGDFSYNVIKI